MHLVKLLLSAFFLFVFNLNVYADNANKRLISYTLIGDFSQRTAELTLKKIPPLDALSARYTLKLYKIGYQTTAPDGSITLASGLVALPVATGKPVSILCYYHGTRFERNDVPSRNNERHSIYLATFGSSAGFMTVMPDYLGLGDSSLALHPYLQADTLASSSVHMLMAAKELANLLHYPTNNTLYLSGYSEGGFTTMVMFEKLIKEYPELPITAVAPGSAPFGWKETINFIMRDPGPRSTAYLAYFFYSLQTYKRYWTSLDEIFVPPYTTLIPALLDGFHTVPEILQALPHDPKLIFQPVFFEGILNETDKNTNFLNANFNHYTFKPHAPLLLVGSKGDKEVPFAGAEMAYELFKKQSDSVWIKSVSDTLDHTQAHPFVLKEQLEFFSQYENRKWY